MEHDGTAPWDCPEAATWQESVTGVTKELSRFTTTLPVADCPRLMVEGLRTTEFSEICVPVFSSTDTVFSPGLVTTRSVAPSPFKSAAAIPAEVAPAAAERTGWKVASPGLIQKKTLRHPC